MEEALFYKNYEARQPKILTKPSTTRILLFRFFAIIYLAVAVDYLVWRWTQSINPDALLFSVVLLMAEILMFIGSVLLIINNWSSKEIKKKKPVHLLSQIEPEVEIKEDRPIEIDVFITTYNEPLTLVEDTIIDAKKVTYPYRSVKINIFLCDDGRRDGRDADKENFRALAEKHNIFYFTRENNKGFKAGNLNHAFWQTTGDLLVILDADTRLFPDFLINLTGYFKNKKMAWVQSPQWFYNISEGITLKEKITRSIPKIGDKLANIVPFSSKIVLGRDIYGTDPTIFYNVILLNRNASNSAFCCGAGSIHRRKALESLILNHSDNLLKLDSTIRVETEKIKNKHLLRFTGGALGPFVHHISEDIYTSILQHCDSSKWQSYQHPYVECKMLSPNSLPSYIRQFSRYAEGSFSIFFSVNNPIIKKGHSLGQRLAYGETLFSYFSAFWVLILLISPIIFYFTLIPPLKAFSFDFFLRLIMLNIFIQIMLTIIHWEIPTNRSEQYYMASFWYKILALTKVIFGKSLTFNTTSKSKDKEAILTNLKFVFPHILIVILTIAGFLYNVYLIKMDLHPSYSAFVANTIWAGFNIYNLSPILAAAFKVYTNE